MQVELFWSLLDSDEGLQQQVLRFWTSHAAWPKGFLVDPTTLRPLSAKVRRARLQSRLKLTVRAGETEEGHRCEEGQVRRRRLPEASTCSRELTLSCYSRCEREG